MSSDPIGAAFDAMIGVVTQLSQTAGLMLTEVKRLGERERELTDDVAELGLRVTTLAQRTHGGHSLRVVGGSEHSSQDGTMLELIHQLRTDFEALERRVGGVHEDALRALTALTERKPVA